MSTSARPWHVNAIKADRIIGDETAQGWDKLHINAPNCTVATVYRADDARLICTSINREAAFEAMREALRAISNQTCDHGAQETCPRETARAALALADSIERGKA